MSCVHYTGVLVLIKMLNVSRNPKSVAAFNCRKVSLGSKGIAAALCSPTETEVIVSVRRKCKISDRFNLTNSIT
jgi:hypothetical protein